MKKLGTIHTHENTPRCNVFVNGDLVKYVLMFDDVRGKCVMARQPITAVYLKNGEARILRHTVYGKVTYEPVR